MTLSQLLPFGRHRRPMQFWLNWLVVGCIVPAAVVAGFLIVQSYQRERASLERDMVATARALMQAVDADINGFHQILQTLAVSRALTMGDLRSFYDEAQALLKSQIASNFVVHDRTGQQLVNTVRPFGAPLPRETGTMVNRAIETGKPQVSDLFRGPATGRMVLGTTAPVFVDGEVKYLVGMGMFSERLGEVLKRQKIPVGWVVSILDRNGTIGARTENQEEYVGKKGAPELLQAAESAEEGTYEIAQLGSEPILGAFSRSPRTGWMIAFAVPVTVVTAGLHQALLLNVALAIVLLLLGAVFARRVSQRLTHSLESLAAPALALGAGEKAAVPQVEIREADELGQALARAAELIETRARERDLAEQNERRMLVQKQAADDANRAKSEFLALMSHELRRVFDGLAGVFTMVIILGGIISGVFTATEAGAAASVYGLFLTVFVYKEIKFSELPEILWECCMTNAVVMMLIATSSVFSWILTYENLPRVLAENFFDLIQAKWAFLLILNGFLLIVGMFIDMTPAIIMLAPILIPVSLKFGVDMVHLGLIIVINLSYGLTTPPVGTALFVAVKVGKISMEKLIPPLLPLLACMLVVLLFVTYVPESYMWLPRSFGLVK